MHWPFKRLALVRMVVVPSPSRSVFFFVFSFCLVRVPVWALASPGELLLGQEQPPATVCFCVRH